MLWSSYLVMGILNSAEVVIILIIAAVIIFGARKIPEIARSLGKASTEYEKSRIEAENEIKILKNTNNPNNTNNTNRNLSREKLETIADKLGIDYSSSNDDELRTAIETEIKKQK
jgi:sec-independent protein translocase protein TatA